jgi:hypothetical protein
MSMFERGLKDKVKERLAFDGAKCKDLDELIARAIDLDDK